MRVSGVDISHHQDADLTPQRIDFEKMASKADFVFIKASQQVADPHFVHNWGASKEVGLLRGAYHYLDWTYSITKQADLFIALLKDDPGELPPIIDMEQAPVPVGSASLLKYFMARIENELHVVPMLYTGYYYWLAYGSRDASWAKYPFWLAWWADESRIKVPPPWTKWTFWQYTNKGVGLDYGVESKEIDLDVFNGTKEELMKFAGIGCPPNPGTIRCPRCGLEIKIPD